jgi:hypothetical protein
VVAGSGGVLCNGQDPISAFIFVRFPVKGRIGRIVLDSVSSTSCMNNSLRVVPGSHYSPFCNGTTEYGQSRSLPSCRAVVAADQLSRRNLSISLFKSTTKPILDLYSWSGSCSWAPRQENNDAL